MAPTERTALHDRHRELGGRMVTFAGWELPQHYSSIREEQAAVRAEAGLFDLSHMGRVEVRGRRAAGLLQELTTNDIDQLEPGRAQYTLMCREDGGILDDLVVYRHGGDDFTVVVNASNRESDLAWMRDHAGPEVAIRDRTREVALLALQGPKAEAVLPCPAARSLPYFGCESTEVGGIPAMVSRTGYTGEDGFEIFLAADAAAGVWDLILETGASAGVKPCGLGARDVCRLEAGLRLYGSDMDVETNPYEAGLGWTVRLQKRGDFVGRAALEAAKAGALTRKLAGLKGAGRSIPRAGTRVAHQREQVGVVTSGTYSFFLEQGIGMALIAPALAQPGVELELELRDRPARAEVVPLPFYRGSVRSMTATSSKS